MSLRAGGWWRGQVTNHAHTPAQRRRRLEKTCRMSGALGLQARGAKLRMGEPQNLGSQTDASDVCVHAQSIANDPLILSRRTHMFRSRLGTYKRATCSPAILPNPNHLTTPMSHPTSHEVLAFVTGLPTVAGLQRITVQMQRIPRLVLQNPTAFFPSNPHPHLMLGGGHHEMYSTFLDIAAHHLQRNDWMYVIVKLERWTREPIDVDSSAVVRSARRLLRR